MEKVEITIEIDRELLDWIDGRIKFRRSKGKTSIETN
jgi:hypothetical protein